MIDSLYDVFKSWSAKGSVYIISDTHFDDDDCKLMDPDWIAPEEHIARLRKHHIGRNDTLIHLGDVGRPDYLDAIRCHKVLIMGNHDTGKANFSDHFDEVYDGPLFIGPEILLSHEPIIGLPWCVNIHGHDHAGTYIDDRHINLASNVYGYDVMNLGSAIKSGLLSNVSGIHRGTINRATARKRNRRSASGRR